ncbi:hypothetical protein KY290_013423 [Solanum tuberosum]|uniref:Uncharacterized protein n=1 Tax=Solanum tuberosum TaxID=4113 RepID=A0ABQ7VPF5_SOLTU|nr:hypothetical protein KY285_012885 [Solanum tuberosum]KAH0769442.1 hypothetical protein KY290_013423 [Solanum tuberosum]
MEHNIFHLSFSTWSAFRELRIDPSFDMIINYLDSSRLSRVLHRAELGRMIPIGFAYSSGISSSRDEVGHYVRDCHMSGSNLSRGVQVEVEHDPFYVSTNRSKAEAPSIPSLDVIL